MTLPSSNSYSFAPSSGELILYAFAEVGVRRSQIEEEHLVNARMASNLIFSDWSNDQPHLFNVDLLSIPLVQGVPTYQLPGNTVLALDVYLRTFSLPNIFNVAPVFTTAIGSANVACILPNNGLSPGNWFNIVNPVSIGGLILLGYYQVFAVGIAGSNQFTFTAAGLATSSVSGGGVVPEFTTAALTSTVIVTLPNHGQSGGFTWNIQIATQVGGVTLQGAYTVQTVIDANHFTITSQQRASTTASAYENTGLVQIATQSSTVNPTDRILWPFGRTEWASIPNPAYQAPPTTFWFNRLIAPQINLYPAPDGNGPYALQVYRVRQDQDVNGTFAETVDVPYRFLRAYQSELSVALAVIYGPDRLQMLEARRDRFLGRAQTQDTEKVPIYIRPQMSGYHRR